MREFSEPMTLPLVEALKIALRKDPTLFSEDELLDLMKRKLQISFNQRRNGEVEEADYTESVADDIKELLKLRIQELSNPTSK